MNGLALILLASAWGDNWPQFRGPDASGIAEGAKPPDAWDRRAIRWKTPVAGLAHSSPIVWRNQIFVTTAVSSQPGATFKHGLYGDGDASPDTSVHQWKVLCLDKRTGVVLWERVAYQGPPKEKRHIKSTYANSTPVTDGKRVVAFFGSQGLFAFDMSGNPLWKRDLGVLRLGAYDAPDYEWGTASSPILYRDMVIVQCDTQGKESFLMALSASTGETIWKSPREELPSWGTPAVANGELITNGSNAIRGYDPATGKQLWSFGGSSKITAPTPVFANGLAIVASGRRPEAPIFAIKLGSQGSIAWSKQQRGPYMPTPLILDGRVYVLNNNGIFDCYDLATGNEVYRQRIEHAGGGFSGSPVAANGRIYLSNEDGEMIVVRAGPRFEIVSRNEIGERLMATPAITGNMLVIRGEKNLIAIGR